MSESMLDQVEGTEVASQGEAEAKPDRAPAVYVDPKKLVIAWKNNDTVKGVVEELRRTTGNVNVTETVVNARVTYWRKKGVKLPNKGKGKRPPTNDSIAELNALLEEDNDSE